MCNGICVQTWEDFCAKRQLANYVPYLELWRGIITVTQLAVKDYASRVKNISSRLCGGARV
jgi:hypothetical protein